MAVVVENIVSGADAVAGTTQTINYSMVNPNAGQNRQLHITTAAHNRANPTLTYNGVSATRNKNSGGVGTTGLVSAQLFILDDVDLPTDTDPHAIVVTWVDGSCDDTVFIVREVSVAKQGVKATIVSVITHINGDPGVLTIVPTVDAVQLFLVWYMAENRTITSIPGDVDFTKDTVSAGINKLRGHKPIGPTPAASTQFTWDISSGAQQFMIGYQIEEAVNPVDTLTQPGAATDIDGLTAGSLKSTKVGYKRITAEANSTSVPGSITAKVT